MTSALFVLYVGILAPLIPTAPKEDPKKALDEIIQVSKKWEVEETVGTVRYKLLLTFNGKATGTVGVMSGTATVKYKKKNVTVKIALSLTRSRFLFITRYPALNTVFAGTMISSDQKLMPLRRTISQRATMILKKNKLCPKSMQFATKCMKPASK
ncbi:hypothetical protein KKF84_17530 [Myxococcota bacterium]|nr:hypothetical protein [Myxococcota bacterium]